MEVAYEMTAEYLAAPPRYIWRPDDAPAYVRWSMSPNPDEPGWVLEGDRLLGAVRLNHGDWDQASTLRDLLIPLDAVPVLDAHTPLPELLSGWPRDPSWTVRPVVRDMRLLGVVHIAQLPVQDRVEASDGLALSAEDLLRGLLAEMASGLLILDRRGRVASLNPTGAAILGTTPEAVVGRPYAEVASLLFPHVTEYLRDSPIPAALSGMAPTGERRRTLPNGRHLLLRYGTIRRGDDVAAVVITFMDISALVEAEARARHAAWEAEQAFGLALPNSKVESKLKASPEYTDTYHPETGTATVTGVVPDGTYRHVINGLRLMAELKAVGLFQLVGIDKDTLVQAFIFHDIGKEQPELAVGQEFVPAKTFEPGWRHAYRSADWARAYYGVSADVETLIRYHHTPEAELPATFPPSLKPMWRLLKVVDGLSAALTRREATLDPFVLRGSRLVVGERNRDIRYHRRYELALYSGDERDLPWPAPV
jgi:PAS domain S-box-containing protein